MHEDVICIHNLFCKCNVKSYQNINRSIFNIKSTFFTRVIQVYTHSQSILPSRKIIDIKSKQNQN